jgi:hypothetical protein
VSTIRSADLIVEASASVNIASANRLMSHFFVTHETLNVVVLKQRKLNRSWAGFKPDLFVIATILLGTLRSGEHVSRMLLAPHFFV